jgi:hypothetical protein
MLKITIPAIEQYNEITEEFITSPEKTIQLEHSLVSLSKWESKWKKPFLSKDEKSIEEITDYIKCMTITQNVDDNIYLCITSENFKDVREYIEAPMTATTIKNEKKGINREIVTAEVIYHWMIALNIPFECQKWHLNRLLTLINVCNIKNAPPKKTNKKELMSRNTSLNAKRKQALNTRG